MLKKCCILAMDQGTTSSRAMVFGLDGSVIAVAQQEFRQIYPHDGWVEHDPADIWKTSLATAQQAFQEAEGKGFSVEAIGITNQRETTLVWDKKTGEPVYNAIVWQDRRTAAECRRLKSDAGAEESVQQKSGLLLDPYFSASKITWILDNVEGARVRADNGELAFGTVDSFLIWHLTGGTQHVTDATNASRTNLFNITTQCWDQELLSLFKVPASMVPEVLDCAAQYGVTAEGILNREIPIMGVAGDQQAAAFGQCCFDKGTIKSTYGTGCFAILNTGSEPLFSKNRLLTTTAFRLGGKPTYALEGSIFIAGAAVQWLRDGLKIVQSAAETEDLAASLKSNNGVYMVPAFTGLGAPYWDPEARASLFGMTRATGKAEIVRATLESICFQTADLLEAMAADGTHPADLRVDGGMVGNDWLVQFLADVLQLPVSRPVIMETTALGAAMLAGLSAGLYGSLSEVAKIWQQDRLFKPAASKAKELTRWRHAVEATRAFARDGMSDEG
ncbi:glycerol kinase GlpK [Kordiimonas pumila]|uniref:Glycerol kinase n=1 Tax=Kordiimonas pumila TaxID=2161677 RepID=A0ABV7D639_9PROT|nr:glycerol kinase GlpK [Kordiimonas pumila]